jgi:hypothetical protein
VKENLNRHWTTTKFLAHLLSQKLENHVNMCQGLQGRLERDTIFRLKTITCDETLVYMYEPKTN